MFNSEADKAWGILFLWYENDIFDSFYQEGTAIVGFSFLLSKYLIRNMGSYYIFKNNINE